MTSHMRREIAEQPAAVAATLAAVAEPAAALAAAVREGGVDRVVLVARGTSDHVAIYARYLLEARCALSASLAAPSLYTTYRPPIDLSRALVLGVSQSGQTPEIVAALEFAAARGALTAALTNEAGSPLAQAVSHPLVTAAGVEQSVAATKTFTTALAVVAELARALGAADLAEPLKPWRARSTRPLRCPTRSSTSPRARWSTPRPRSASRVAMPTRRRSRRRSSSRRSPGCGPRATARPICATGRARLHSGSRRSCSTPGARWRRRRRARARARRGGIAGRLDRTRACVAGRRGPAEELAPIALIAPAQLVAERLAVLRGRDPDRPPGLTKVTRTH